MEAVPRVALTRRDWGFIAVCAAVSILCLFIVVRYFGSAFPEASIEFRYDRAASRQLAERLLAGQKLPYASMKHSAVFSANDIDRIFLERSLGLKKANDVMRNEVRVWYWQHRWFRPLQEEEYAVAIAPTGQLVAFGRKLPEALPMPSVDAAGARSIAEAFLTRNGVALADLTLVSQSERSLPRRVQRIFTWESKSIRPAGAPYRHTITVDGNAVTGYGQNLKVPEEWLRSYREMRSKNILAGNVDTVFLIITMIAALAIFIIRLRRGDMSVKFLLAIGAITFVLVTLVSVNSLPSTLAGYNTTASYPAFIAQIVVFTILQSVGMGMMLIVICGAGEVLYRERFPQHLAMPRLWTRRALTSKRVFDSLLLGYTLVFFFIAYQVVFYLVAARYGAWSPADVPYDDMLNTALPWVAVLFAGFFPAFSEEFLSRAFSVPFFERVLKSRLFAIVLAGFIWGFGHATYPNQPFYIRGLEVGLAGVVIGLLMYRFGILSLLIWHYTVDAIYTALLLLRSGNTYYIFSGLTAALVFAVPLVVSIVLYVRNKGFVPDEDLTNASLPVSIPPEVPAAEGGGVPLGPILVTRRQVIVAVVLVAIAVAFALARPASTDDVVNYKTSSGRAKEIGAAHLRALRQPVPEKVAAAPVSGFRLWDPESPREEGGSPSGFDDVAATYMVRNGLGVRRLIEIMRTRIQAATWTVRYFTPTVKTEYFMEVDPRTARVIGYHKYADESAPGPRLDREAALAIARRAFATYGGASGQFNVKDALSFPQPNRTDWLFHFEERVPLVAKAYRRVTVRVMGDEITQYAVTVKVPDEVYRQASEERLGNVALLILKVIGSIGLLALIVTGFIISSRHSGLSWRKAARLTALLAIIPILGALSQYESRLFDYRTDVLWNTFVVGLVTDLVRTAGLQILMLFIAIAGVLAAFPNAITAFSREGARGVGRAATIATLAAISLFVAGRELMRLIVRQFPSLVAVRDISIPDSVALPMPALFELASAIFEAVLFSGAVALFIAAVRTWEKKWLAPAVTMFLVFCVSLDSSVTASELPLMIITRLILAVMVWVIGWYILDGNVLAWPLAAFTAAVFQSGMALAQNDRADLRLNAAILFAIGLFTLIWTTWQKPIPNSESTVSDTQTSTTTAG